MIWMEVDVFVLGMLMGKCICIRSFNPILLIGYFRSLISRI